MADIKPPPIERGPTRYRVTISPSAYRGYGWTWELETNLGSSWAWWSCGYGFAWTEERAAKKAQRALAKLRARDAREDAAKAAARTWEVGP